jgi:hypothetical protein
MAFSNGCGAGRKTLRRNESRTMSDDTVVPLSMTEAMALDKRIRLLANHIRDSVEQITQLLVEARDGQIWLTLGHKSYGEYVKEALGGRQVDRAVRQAVVPLMLGERMPVKTIAEALGVHRRTIDRDINQDAHTRIPDTFIGADGVEQKREHRRVPSQEELAAEESYTVIDAMVDTLSAEADCMEAIDNVQQLAQEMEVHALRITEHGTVPDNGGRCMNQLRQISSILNEILLMLTPLVTAKSREPPR